MLKDRDKTLDFIKFVAIILVVTYHSFYLQKCGLPYVALYSLCSMGVPLFFLVNGALLLNSIKPFNLHSHCKKVAWIMTITALWGGVILTLIKLLPANQGMSWMRYAKILWYLESGYVINHYWFLCALVMIYIFYPLIKYTFDADKRSLLFFASVVFLLTFGNKIVFMFCQLFMYFSGRELFTTVKNCIPWYNFIHKVPNAYALCYFIFGGVLYSYMQKDLPDGFLGKKNRIMTGTVFSISWIASTMLGLLLTAKIKWDPCFDGYDMITTFLMTLSVFVLLKNLKRIYMPRLFALIANNTLGIYLVHGFLIYVSRPWVADIAELHNVVGFVLYVVGVIASSLLIVLTIKRIPLLRETVHL